MINQIYLRRKNKLILTKGNEHTPNLHYIATILANFESLGYTFLNLSLIHYIHIPQTSLMNSIYPPSII